jgi:hypothetical protein
VNSIVYFVGLLFWLMYDIDCFTMLFGRNKNCHERNNFLLTQKQNLLTQQLRPVTNTAKMPDNHIGCLWGTVITVVIVGVVGGGGCLCVMDYWWCWMLVGSVISVVMLVAVDVCVMDYWWCWMLVGSVIAVVMLVAVDVCVMDYWWCWMLVGSVITVVMLVAVDVCVSWTICGVGCLWAVSLLCDLHNHDGDCSVPCQ